MTTRRLKAGLLQACDELFGITLWPKQREILAEIEAGPRMHVLALGRRSGKTTIAALVALWDALLRPSMDDLVRPGEVRYSVCVATNLPQARQLLRAARSIVEGSPALHNLIEGSNENELRFTLPSGARTALKAFPCSSRGGRGYPISTVTFDEAAFFFSDSDGNAALESVFSALVPSTAQFSDKARVVLASTPFGLDNAFGRYFAQAANGELVDAAAHHFSTAEMNPHIDPAFLESEQARDPDGFPAEYLAEFAGSGNAFIDFDKVTISDRTGDLPPEAGSGWVLGLDPGFREDRFGLCAVGAERGDPRRLLIGTVAALPKKTSFTAALAEVAEVANRYGARISTDQFAAAAVTEALRSKRLSVAVVPITGQSKAAVYGEMRARLYSGLALPADPKLIGELRRLRIRNSGASAQIESPRSSGKGHGDRAASLALATFAHRRATEGARRVRVGRYGGVDVAGSPAVPGAWDV